MATQEFAGPSPFALKETWPEDDYFHTEYLDYVTAKKRTDTKPLLGAIFGLGRAGSIHFSSIVKSPRIKMKYIIDDREEKFEDLKSYWQLGDDIILLTSKDQDIVFNDESVNVVFIGSPTFTHRNFILKSIAKNKDVFCEKPIAKTVEETKECYDFAKSKGRILMAAFNRRFDPAYKSLKDRVRKGEIGHAQILRVTSRDSPIPAYEYLTKSGGLFHDCMVHDFDISCWVLGELPIRAQATASSHVPELKAINQFDTVAFLLTFPSGAVAMGDTTRYCAYGYDMRLEVFGNKGMIKVENERPMHSTESYIEKTGVKLSPIFYSFPSRFKQSYIRELEHFLDVVQFGVKLEVTGSQTLAVSKIATAVEKSACTGQSVEIEWSKEEILAVYS